MKADLDQHERSAAQVVGQERGVRQLEHPTERLAASRARSRSSRARRAGSPPRARSARTGPRRRSRAIGNSSSSMRGHRADVAASAAERPEQLGLGVAVGADTPAVGGDHVRRDDAVAGEPVLADHPAEAATERVAEHADVRRRAGEIGEAVLAGRNREWLRRGRPPRRARVARRRRSRCRASAPS